MLSPARSVCARGISPARSFTTSAPRSSFARLVVCGNLVEAPRKQATKSGKPFLLYRVATSDKPGPPNADGTFPDRTSTFHSILSYQGVDKEYLTSLPKGTLVHIEASYQRKSEKRDDASYNETTFLTLEKMDILKKGVESTESTEGFANTEQA